MALTNKERDETESPGDTNKTQKQIRYKKA